MRVAAGRAAAIAVAGLVTFAARAEIETTGTASSGEFGVGVSDHLIFSGEQVDYGDGPTTTGLFLHEADVQAQYETLRVAIKFSNSLLEDASDLRYKPFNLEKKLARIRLGSWDLAAGDTHHEFGKGLALSLYSDPAFGLNNTLEGVSVRYLPENVEFGAFAGRINALEAPVAINPVTNPLLNRTVWLAGGGLQGNFNDTYRGGAHAFVAFNQPDGEDFDKRWQTVGAFVERRGLLDGVSFYAESNALFTARLTDEGDTSQPTGFASFASLDYFPVPWRFTIEAKDYRNYRFEFRRPPTLEDDLVTTLNTEDVSAARIAVERRFLGLQGKARLSHLVGEDRVKNSELHHTVASTEFPGPSRSKVTLAGGYRWLPGKETLTHAGVAGKIPTYGPQSIEVGIRRQLLRENLDFLPTETDRTNVDLTYNFSSKFNITLGYEWLPTHGPDQNEHFANIGAALKMGALASRAFVGQTSGGTQCSGGVCRTVPPYTGAMLESSYKF